MMKNDQELAATRRHRRVKMFKGTVSPRFTASSLTPPDLEFQPDLSHTEVKFDVVESGEQSMSWKKLLESASESLNDHLRLRNDYLMAENRILRNQIDGRVKLTDSERQELAELGAKLGKKALAEIATVAQPDTILAWNRKFANPNVSDERAAA